MWFAAKLLFESSVPREDGRIFQEESIWLIEANDKRHADEKAASFGVSEHIDYLNDRGETVRWQFVSILEIQDLCESNVFDGMEVFSTLKWKGEKGTG